VQPVEPGADELLAPLLGKEGPVGVEAHTDAASGRVLDHAKEVGRQKRLAQTLECHFLEGWKLVHDRLEGVEAHGALAFP
jgi:hypothetical protein